MTWETFNQTYMQGGQMTVNEFVSTFCSGQNNYLFSVSLIGFLSYCVLFYVDIDKYKRKYPEYAAGIKFLEMVFTGLTFMSLFLLVFYTWALK